MSFNVFPFNSHLTKAIALCGYSTPTPIQQQAIVPILNRRDLLGLAQTGTGKTAAFVLPTVQHILQQESRSGVKSLILAPTRELAEQINDFTSKIIAGSTLRCMAIYGGVSKSVQLKTLRRGVDIIVACPGRLLDIMNDGVLDLSHIDTLILDEADHMFDKGFLPDIRRIMRQLPTKRQSLVFSATMPSEIRHLAEEILHDPVVVKINPSQPVKNISHKHFAVEQGQKTALLVHLLSEQNTTTTLVFTRTKHKAKSLASQLDKSGFRVTSLQGNLSQCKRQQALDGFKSGLFNVLVATDIAARGIDVRGISHVINYDVPDTVEAYIHRTGRTGRAAANGEAITFVTTEDKGTLRSIERTLDKTLERQVLPSLYPGAPVAMNSEQGREVTPSVLYKKNGSSDVRRKRDGDSKKSIFSRSGRSRH